MYVHYTCNASYSYVDCFPLHEHSVEHFKQRFSLFQAYDYFLLEAVLMFL